MSLETDLWIRWFLDPVAWLIAGVAFGIIEVLLPTYFFLGLGLAAWELALVMVFFSDAFAASGFPLSLPLAMLGLLAVGNWWLMRTFMPYRGRNQDGADDINQY